MKRVLFVGVFEVVVLVCSLQYADQYAEASCNNVEYDYHHHTIGIGQSDQDEQRRRDAEFRQRLRSMTGDWGKEPFQNNPKAGECPLGKAKHEHGKPESRRSLKLPYEGRKRKSKAVLWRQREANEEARRNKRARK
jgi:hypothetical protein